MKNQETDSQNDLNPEWDPINAALNFKSPLLFENIASPATMSTQPSVAATSWTVQHDKKRKKDVPKESETIEQHMLDLKEERRISTLEYQAFRLANKDNDSRKPRNKYASRLSRLNKKIEDCEKDLEIVKLSETIRQLRQENDNLRQENHGLVTYNNLLQQFIVPVPPYLAPADSSIPISQPPKIG